MATVAIALGSNVGDRLAHLRAAFDALSDHLGALRASAVYETAPMYVEDQPPFLNAAILARTGLGPLPLLRLVKEIERAIGRKERERNAAREIDLDLILFGSARYTYVEGGVERLRLPHPRAAERRFVLQPLHDLNPEMALPGIGSVSALLEADKIRLQRVELKNGASLSVQGR